MKHIIVPKYEYRGDFLPLTIHQVVALYSL